jgi:hypothetical protein
MAHDFAKETPDRLVTALDDKIETVIGEAEARHNDRSILTARRWV